MTTGREFKVKFKDQVIPAVYATTPDEARAALARLQPGVTLAIDTETMALPEYRMNSKAALSPHLASIRLIQLFDGETSVILDMLTIGFRLDKTIRKFLETHRFIAHNAVFDMAFLKNQFAPKTLDMGCTFIAFKLLAHAIRATDDGLRASLEAVTEGLCGVKILKQNQKSDWSVPELIHEQLEYAALDPICVFKVAEKLAPAIQKKRLFEFYDLVKAAQHPIVDMHLNGIGFDAAKHIELTATWREGLYEAKKKLLAATGLGEITGPKIAAWIELHVKPQHLQIWPRTDSGTLKTDAITLADYSTVSPAIKKFSAFQKFKILTTDFGGRLLQQLNEATGRLHPQYHLCGTRTGRLSCSTPNLQQSPRDKAFRSQFIPSKGCVFIGADYSMIELRVAAEVSRDPTMLRAFRNGADLHNLMGSQIAGTDIETLDDKARKQARQIAKNVNFGCIYGIGAKKFASYARKASDDSTITEESAGELIQIFRRTYAGYRAWHVRLYEKCMETLRVRTACGKLRKLAPELCYGAAPNTIVQGSAAGCMLWSLVLLHKKILAGEIKARIIASIHDELIIEALPQDAEAAKVGLEQAMIQGFKKVFPKGVTKNLVEAKIGNNWQELK